MRNCLNVLLGAMLVSAFGCSSSGDSNEACTPECAGKLCGSNGCGGLCGQCGDDMACDAAGLCVAGGHLLAVSKEGTGTGTVKGGAIDCGGICSAKQAEGISVTLTATPAADSSFTSWSGCDSANGANCSVTMSEPRSVVATFSARPGADSPRLVVSKSGAGSGSIVEVCYDDDTGEEVDCGDGSITCDPVCSARYLTGYQVALAAHPDGDSKFVAWTGCDMHGVYDGVSHCFVTMDGDQQVGGEFGKTTSGGGELSLAARSVGAWGTFATTCSGEVNYSFFLCPGGRIRGAGKFGNMTELICGTYDVTPPVYEGCDDKYGCFPRIAAAFKSTLILGGQSDVTNETRDLYQINRDEIHVQAPCADKTTVGWVHLARGFGDVSDDDCVSSACPSSSGGAYGTCGADCDCGYCWYCDSGKCRYGGKGEYGCYRGCPWE